MTKDTKTHIGIIGAGYTGLVAAYRLAQSGCQVTLLEKTNELGGLAADFKLHGAHLEKFYHFTYKTDNYLIDLIKELGLEETLHWHRSSIAIYYKGQHYPFMTPLDLLKFKPLSIFDRIRTGLIAFYLQRLTNWKKIASYTAYDWMTKFAGKNVRDIIWTPLLKGKFDKYYKDISMVWLWKRIKVRIDSKEKGEPTERLGQLEGGFYSITNGLVEKLHEYRVKIVTNAPVEKVIKNSATGEITVVTPKSEFQFDKVIITTPSPVAAEMLADNQEMTTEYLRKLNYVNYLGAAVFIFSSRQKLGDYYWYNINDPQASFLVFINLTKLVSTEKFQGNYVYYIGAYVPHDHEYFRLAETEIINRWVSYLKKMFPDFRDDQLLEKHLFRMRYAQHNMDVGYEQHIPSYTAPAKGVYLANFSQIFPDDRGLNYAVREGDNIAKLVLGDIRNEI
ncbi:NAD(P)/FAD-dependent oxidoreductase [Patescibacteria group bacterium]|nr:NAD(P)/FAD-dependent oxidoreductase [Patescibacteria group bacterium]MBU1868297.1 NAD(P)/FAD-dependent oxidoreductase [Patescibacteria group bacterium]